MLTTPCNLSDSDGPVGRTSLIDGQRTHYAKRTFLIQNSCLAQGAFYVHVKEEVCNEDFHGQVGCQEEMRFRRLHYRRLLQGKNRDLIPSRGGSIQKNFN